jgi:hypothetical protein
LEAALARKDLPLDNQKLARRIAGFFREGIIA